MQSLPSQLMRPFSLSLASPSSQSRCLGFVSISFPTFQKFNSHPKFLNICPKAPPLTVRNCSSISAKPSSELRKKRAGSEPDEKLRALRQLFSKPGIGIDAYIIPSQDAHQVHCHGVIIIIINFNILVFWIMLVVEFRLSVNLIF